MQSDAEDCFQFKIDNASSERHIVEVVFGAKRQAGPIKQTIHIATDLGENFNATVNAYATILPAAPATVEPTATAIQIEAGTASAAGSGTTNVVSQ
jgi:hypothetical protein